MELVLNNLKDAKRFGEKLAQIARQDDIFLLIGNLGSGKTTIARAFIKYLTKNDKILSPTFPMLITYEYDSNIIWHYDMYRLENPADVWNLNLEDALNSGIILIEWPEIIEHLIPSKKIEIILNELEENRRSVEIKGRKELLKEFESFNKN
ncbi:MAG: tRNA (adenosine(37)-N6)-threonylcarbamoyltransferase complex ATPase subunit type 1 TsaE [Pelagibacterales bacterium]|nr:tRNA (adenosine(37)-N6)-threonylcarbamoyltransferase complex ATPase subunit type 1 TsaE [Pelagibacterales bacterium]PPR16708.1 MAG: tRNA threonylcarbamoyladenosine biosynthesis protein TsaE [Alphaproteobacteria bacterium MarineAlpha9_Bin3]|tara:strand:+ start:9992 stop:10444 length:453 start_codon:yes stop_codon:yes gene_type:complete